MRSSFFSYQCNVSPDSLTSLFWKNEVEGGGGYYWIVVWVKMVGRAICWPICPTGPLTNRTLDDSMWETLIHIPGRRVFQLKIYDGQWIDITLVFGDTVYFGSFLIVMGRQKLNEKTNEKIKIFCLKNTYYLGRNNFPLIQHFPRKVFFCYSGSIRWRIKKLYPNSLLKINKSLNAYNSFEFPQWLIKRATFFSTQMRLGILSYIYA